MDRPFEKEASIFCTAILDLAARPEAVENLESYLSMHFAEWLEEYAHDPGNMAQELRDFSMLYD